MLGTQAITRVELSGIAQAVSWGPIATEVSYYSKIIAIDLCSKEALSQFAKWDGWAWAAWVYEADTQPRLKYF